MTRYLTCAETAKLIRAELRRCYPGVKFSVRSSTYAGGASIRVEWTDGPTDEAVTGTARVFAGARFDGMVDLKSYVSTGLCPDHGAITLQFPDTFGSLGEGYPPCCDKCEAVSMGAD